MTNSFLSPFLIAKPNNDLNTLLGARPDGCVLMGLKNGGRNMAGFQKITIIGNLGADPEVRQTASGDSVCNISVATSEKWTSSDGNVHERTEWHRCVLWRKLADLIGKSLHKGDQVHIEGKIKTSKYTNKEGIEVETKEVDVSNFTFLRNGAPQSNGYSNGSPEMATVGAGGGEDIEFDTSDF